MHDSDYYDTDRIFVGLSGEVTPIFLFFCHYLFYQGFTFYFILYIKIFVILRKKRIVCTPPFSHQISKHFFYSKKKRKKPERYTVRLCARAMADSGRQMGSLLHHQGGFLHNYYTFVSLQDSDHEGVVRMFVALSC